MNEEMAGIVNEINTDKEAEKRAVVKKFIRKLQEDKKSNYDEIARRKQSIEDLSIIYDKVLNMELSEAYNYINEKAGKALSISSHTSLHKWV